MRIVDNEGLKKLKESRKVKSSDADTLMAKAISKKVSPPPDRQAQAIESLVLSVASAVKANSDLSQKATGLLKDMFIRVSKTPPAPAVVFPEPARQWKLTVTKRDADKLIETVDLVRIDDDGR